jgi:hypothetical protein
MRNQFYTSSPKNDASLGMFAYNNDETLPGITSITFKHTEMREGFDLDYAPTLETVNFPKLTTVTSDNDNYAYFYSYGCVNLTTITAPLLVHIDDFEVDTCIAFQEVSAPLLETSKYIRFYNLPLLTEISFPSLTQIGAEGGFFGVEQCVTMSVLNLPSLREIQADCVIQYCGLTSLSLPSLQIAYQSFTFQYNDTASAFHASELTHSFNLYIQNNASLVTVDLSAMTDSSDFRISGNPQLTNIDLGLLQTINNYFEISNNDSLVSLSLVSVGIFSSNTVITFNDNFTSLYIPNATIPNGGTLNLEGNALDLATIERVFLRASASAMTSGTINVSGGTSAVPTGSILDLYNQLTGSGVTVYINNP